MNFGWFDVNKHSSSEIQNLLENGDFEYFYAVTDTEKREIDLEGEKEQSIMLNTLYTVIRTEDHFELSPVTDDY